MSHLAESAQWETPLKTQCISGIGRRMFVVRFTRNLVSVGGVSIIFSILAILFVIVAVAFPLFKSPEIHLENMISVSQDGAPVFLVGVDEYREVVYTVKPSEIQFHSLINSNGIKTLPLSSLGEATIVSADSDRNNLLALGLSDGRVLPVQVEFEVSYANDVRTVLPKILEKPAIRLFEDGKPVSRVAVGRFEEGFRIAAVKRSTLILNTVVQRRTLMGTVKNKEYHARVDLPGPTEVRALVFSAEGDSILLGTVKGQILRAILEDPEDENPPLESLGWTFKEGTAVSSLKFLLGGQSLVVGDDAGGIHSYQIKREGGHSKLIHIHSYQPHNHSVVMFSASPRNKGFLSADGNGTVRFHYATTGETQFALPQKEMGLVHLAVIAPKANGIVSVDHSGRLHNWKMDNPHPEISWNALFGKVHYEGYPEADYVWQSTGGTDEFEPKFSLVPLLIGTLKGTFYAILFAVPIALLSAFYTSQFIHQKYKAIIKPVIEIMAALPSVVLGFFAALWLAPNIEKVLPGIVLAPLVILGLIAIYLLGKEYYPNLFLIGSKPGSEIFILTILVILGSVIGLYAGFALESGLLMGDYRTWLNKTLGLSYDQRNSLVVGIAMGFAVIPIIFTIAEDSLSSVPTHLKAGSLALGATVWETAVRVILPTASPGIFSAVMIGFGRAVGETMIVLMATGNTPVMDWSIFNGFRALSANIAVELPEAPEGGTLFRLLFLAAFLLFVLTFIVNSIAEWIRLRLRKRYQVI